MKCIAERAINELSSTHTTLEKYGEPGVPCGGLLHLSPCIAIDNSGENSGVYHGVFILEHRFQEGNMDQQVPITSTSSIETGPVSAVRS